MENLQDLLDLEDSGIEVEWPKGQSSRSAEELIAGGLLPPRYKTPVSKVTQDPQIQTSDQGLDNSVPGQRWHFNVHGNWVKEEEATSVTSSCSREPVHPPPPVRKAPNARGSSIRGRFAFGAVEAEEARMQTERDRRHIDNSNLAV